MGFFQFHKRRLAEKDSFCAAAKRFDGSTEDFEINENGVKDYAIKKGIENPVGFFRFCQNGAGRKSC